MAETTVTKEALEQRIRDALVEFGAEESEIRLDSSWDELDIDSLDLVELAQIVEDEYDVELRESDMEKMKTVGDAVGMVAERLPGS
jgi:acyl carrier protein